MTSGLHLKLLPLLILGLASILLPPPSHTQTIEVIARPLKTKSELRFVSELLGGQTAKLLTVWVVALDNKSAETVIITPGAVRSRLIDQVPLAPEVLQPIIERAETHRWSARMGRIALVVGGVFTTVGTSGLVSMPPQAVAGGAEFVKMAPWLVEQFRGEEIQVGRNFNLLAWRDPVKLDGAQAATVYLFTSRQTGGKAEVQRFVLDLGAAQRVKVAQ